jgi:hypothetical protein
VEGLRLLLALAALAARLLVLLELLALHRAALAVVHAMLHLAQARLDALS